MTKKDSSRVIAEVSAYIESLGGTRSPLYEEVRDYPLAVYEIETDYGPASVSLIPPASSKGMPWLALRYCDMDRIHESIAAGRLSSQEWGVNQHSGKFNCHAADETAISMAAHFVRHLKRAGFPAEAQPADDWMSPDYTCGCGLYVHPSRRNPSAIHIEDCEYRQPADSKIEAPVATQDEEEGFSERIADHERFLMSEGADYIFEGRGE